MLQVHSCLLTIPGAQAVSATSSPPVEGGSDTHGRILCSSSSPQVHVNSVHYNLGPDGESVHRCLLAHAAHPAGSNRLKVLLGTSSRSS